MSLIGPPKDYSEMLNKIFVFTFFGSLICTYLVSLASPAVSSYLNKFSIAVEILGLSVPIAYVVPPLLIAILARIIKLHDKISDLFRIRETFDITEILVPMAGESNFSTSLKVLEYFKKHRRDIMNAVFYKYASSKKPLIDSHMIEMALDRWFWFWVLIESLVIGAITLVTLMFMGGYQIAAWLACFLFAGTLLASFVNRVCARAAHEEVQAILADQARKSEIKAVFDALQI